MSFEEDTQKRVDANGENQLLISAARAFTQASLGPDILTILPGWAVRSSNTHKIS